MEKRSGSKAGGMFLGDVRLRLKGGCEGRTHHVGSTYLVRGRELMVSGCSQALNTETYLRCPRSEEKAADSGWTPDICI